jgi:hypothetical protein
MLTMNGYKHLGLTPPKATAAQLELLAQAGDAEGEG